MAERALVDDLLQTSMPSVSPTAPTTPQGNVVSAEDVALFHQTAPADQQGSVVPAEDVAQFNEEPGLLDEIGKNGNQFTEGVSEDVIQRTQDFVGIATDLLSGKVGPSRAAANMVGKVGFGLAADLIGQSLGLAGRSVADVAGTVTPEDIKQPIIETSAELAEKLLETEAAQAGIAAANEGVETYTAWAEENPLVARDLESVGNIAALLPPARFSIPVLKGLTVIPRVASKQTAGRAGAALTARGTTQEAGLTSKFLDEFVTPVQTAKTKAAAIRQTTEGKGLFGGRTVALDAGQQARKEAVSQVPGVQRGQSSLETTRLVENEVRKEADNLKAALVKNNVPIKPRETRKAFREAEKRLSEKLLLVGDAEKTAQRALKKMSQFASKEPPTASGLLQARKNFDAWVTKQRPKFFDKEGENSIQAAVKEIRGTVNNLIDEKVGAKDIGIDVKGSLRKQSNLLEAADVGHGKAISEGNSKLSRITKRIADKIPAVRDARTREMLVNFSVPTAVGVTGVTAGVPAAMALLAGGGSIAGGLFAASRPAVKKALGSILTAIDDTIAKTTDPKTLAALRADRISVKEMIENSQDEEEPK